MLRTTQQPPGPIYRDADVRWSEILSGQREDSSARLHSEKHPLVLWAGAVCR